MINQMSQNVLITGGTGFIGKYLTQVLLANNFTVSILSRTPRKSSGLITYYQWNPERDYIEEDAILNADYIIHLAGEGIVEKRWTAKRKKSILESRTKPITLIHSLLKKHNKSLNAFISASGIGIYGANTSEQICTEDTPAANDFLGLTCQEWEKTADTIGALGIRTVKIRTGIVFGRAGGFLKKITPGFKAGFGTILGSGSQYLPWIHIEDLSQIYLKSILDTKIEGPYNAVLTDDTTQLKFSKTLANLYGYSIWLPKIPQSLLKIVLGEMSDAILKGQRVSSEKIQHTGFEFQFATLETALYDCLK
ncbi:TIGR01777 family oxidoreductase [Flavobacterium sp. Fl-318]|uniref:TIGR01777 family oxidoreductase n=1 Tax=Flavobacterium cupriresistens TaxID=2893885 RepID=A0ABU4RDV4_9FLAO|nr:MULTISPECIES: TIGR01777 family oxidoreductase [unclassified Flavobacterium]MDX6189864.1 TIGR01777 family oxidoreductase [Flavobacterium sp. Fl-318]UFH42690.1 TIGR01777 family oxidoreductase [Flavobacterium sp. F-323]